MAKYVTDLSSAQGEVLQIAGCLVDPENFPPVRYRDGFGTVATGATSLKHHINVSWNQTQTPATNLQLPYTDTGAFVFRDACRNLVYNMQNPTPGTATFTYTGVVDPDGTGSVTKNQMQVYKNNEMNFAFNYFEYTSGAWKPHGDILYAGIGGAQKKRAVWLDATAACPVTVTFTADSAMGAGVTTDIYLYKWDGGNWNNVGNFIILAGASVATNSSSIVSSGYYAFDVVNRDTTVTSHSYSFSFTSHVNLGSCWAHRCLPGLELNMDEVSDLRILGASMWLKNVSSDLNKNGNIVVSQIPAGSQWNTQYAQSGSPSFYDKLFSVAQERDFVLANGYYGFIKPSSEDDFDYIHNFGHSVGDITSYTMFELETPKDFLALAATCATGGGECILKVGISVEYKTTNEWFERRQPTALADSWSAAISGVCSMQQHYENRVHFKTIMGTIGKIARLASPILSLFGPYGQAAAAAASGVGLVSDVVTGAGDDYTNREAVEQIKDEIRLAQASASARQTKRLRF